MQERPVYIFSDTHLGAAPGQVEAAVLAFLRHARTEASALFINGDLFDFWFEWKSVIPRRGFRVVSALADLQEAGIPVTLIGGNHDCWGGEVLREDAGIAYQLHPWEGTLAGWRARIEHGDGLRPERDRGYRRLRSVLRHPVSVRLFRSLHPDWGTRLAALTSHTSRSRHPRDDGLELRRIGLDLLRSRPDLELLVFGHSHVPALERTPAGGVYANAGAWLEAPTFLRVAEERIELRRWTGSTEGERLHAIDRRSEEALADL